jgi:hypothetical protein
MKSDEPLLYQQYRSGKKQKGWGTFLVIIGAGSFVIGVANGDEIWPAPLAIGGALLATGIPLTIIGSKKKKSALDEYRIKYSEASGKGAPHFQLNAHPNGLGLAYVF